MRGRRGRTGREGAAVGSVDTSGTGGPGGSGGTGSAAARAEARDVHRRLLDLSPAARRLIGATIACGALVPVAVVVQAWIVSDVVSGAIDGRNPVTGALVVFAVAVLARAVLSGAVELLGRRAAERAMHVLRTRIAARALRGRSGRTDEARRGDVVTSAVQGVDALADYYARAVPAVALAGVVPLVVVGAIAWRQPVVGALLLVTLPVLVVFMVLVGRASAEHARERQRALAVLGAHFLEVVRALPTLRAHGRDAAQVETLDAVAGRYRDESLGALRVAFLSALVLELFAMVGIAIAAATVGVLLATGHGELSTGLFVLLLAPEVYAPLRSAGQRFHAAEDGAQAARRALAFLDEPDATARATDDPRAGGAATDDPAGRRDRADGAGPDASAVPVPDPSRAPLRLVGAGVRGSTGRAAPLAPVDLTIAPGRSVALVGPSGAGKTTLLGLLARLRDPDDGRVTCGGVDLAGVPTAAWWAGLAWLPQRPGLPSGTLGDALAIAAGAAWGDADDLDARIARGLALADAGGVLATMPAGRATPVGPGGRTLSAGQTQRLALAGVLASRAPLVLLDEPTAHLDHESAARVADGIVTACAGRTLVVATHDAALAERCDLVVRLEAGSLAGRPVRSANPIGAAR